MTIASRALRQILRAAPHCTLWRYDMQRCVYVFRPYGRIVVADEQIAAA